MLIGEPVPPKPSQTVLSDKSEICMSNFQNARLLAGILNKEGTHYKSVKLARDLGIPYTAGVSSIISGKLIRQRHSKASVRNTKNGKLTKISKRARVLFSGSQYSADTWGHQAVNLANSQIV